MVVYNPNFHVIESRQMTCQSYLSCWWFLKINFNCSNTSTYPFCLHLFSLLLDGLTYFQFLPQTARRRRVLFVKMSGFLISDSRVHGLRSNSHCKSARLVNSGCKPAGPARLRAVWPGYVLPLSCLPDPDYKVQAWASCVSIMQQCDSCSVSTLSCFYSFRCRIISRLATESSLT